MLKLSKKRIIEFQKVFKKEHSKKLSFAEATEAVNNLVGFFGLLLKIDMRENPQNYAKKIKGKSDK